MTLPIITIGLALGGVGLLILATFSTIDLAASCRDDPTCPSALPCRVLYSVRHGEAWEVAVLGILWAVGFLLVLLGAVAAGWGWAANLWVWRALTLDFAFWVVMALVVFFRRRLRE